MSSSRFFSSLTVLAALGLSLVAAPALADKDRCQANCATTASTTMQTCIERCGEPRDPTKAKGFQACALRCKEKFDKAYNTCAQSCDGGSTKKKKSR
jgi:hypothetical protein